MSRHVGRKDRWARVDARRYTSALGEVVHERGAWYAVLDYRTRAPRERAGDLASWVGHRKRLGPFRRPRNAMVALEEEATTLKNRHGADVVFGEQPWGEA